MAKKDALFELIQSMSKAEKRHFRLFSEFQNGGKNYSDLFGAVDRQKEYREDRIRKQFVGRTFLNQLHVTKNYLYKLIMRGLESLHQSKTERNKLVSLIQQVSILNDRALYEQAAKLLRKGVKIAEGQELHVEHLRLLELQEEVLDRLLRASLLETAQKELAEKRTLLLQKLQARYFLSNVSSELAKSTTRDSVITDDFSARLIRLRRAVLAAEDQEDYQTAYEQGQSLLSHFEGHPEKLNSRLSDYEEAYRHCIADGIQLRLDERELLDLLNEYRSIFERFGLKDQELIRRRLEQHYLRFFFQLSNLFPDSNLFDELANSIKDKWDDHRTELLSTPKAAVAKLLVNYHFFRKEFFETMHFLDQWVDSHTRKIPAAEQAALRARYMITGFEMGKWEIALSRIKNLDDLRDPDDTRYRSEKTLYSFFKIVSKVRTSTQVENMFVLLKAELAGLLAKPKEAEVFEGFDVDRWLSNRLRKTSFDEKLKDFSK